MSLGYIPRKSWTTEERKAAKQIFKDEIEVGKSPSLNKCKNVIKQCNALQSRTPNQVKAWVSNKIKKRDEFSRGKGYYQYVIKYILYLDSLKRLNSITKAICESICMIFFQGHLENHGLHQRKKYVDGYLVKTWTGGFILIEKKLWKP